MLEQEDLKWIASTSTELNSMLQQISRYSDLARQHKGEYNYIGMLGERVELASKTAQALFDRVTSTILEGAAAKESALENLRILPSRSSPHTTLPRYPKATRQPNPTALPPSPELRQSLKRPPPARRSSVS